MIYLLSSKIMGYDLKDVFNLYGLAISSTAQSSIAMLNLPTAPLKFYAQPANRSNYLATYLDQCSCKWCGCKLSVLSFIFNETRVIVYALIKFIGHLKYKTNLIYLGNTVTF